MGLFYDLLDGVLEATVVGSFTHVGYHLRRPFWDESDLDVNLEGRVALVTGANSGIGRATASALATRGATTILACRSEERGLEARDAIAREAGHGRVELELVDLSDLDAVREAAARVLARHPALHVLVNNAGVMLHERQLSPQGLEMNFATNVVGPFLLTNLLAPALALGSEEGAPARVITVTSGGMYTQKLDLDDLQCEKLEPFDGVTAYAQNKRAQVLLTETWAERLAGQGVTVNAMHPGWADTPAVQTSLPTFRKITGPFLRDWEQGADTLVWLAVAERVRELSGELFLDRRVRPKVKLSRTAPDPGDHQRLWKTLVELTGQDLALEAPALT
jgi:NAD(P)-dependent dehydrogenase (short-subunit alcohol dehydrogenase family)